MSNLRQTLTTIRDAAKAGKLGASDERGSCLYSDGKGHFCAIGVLLPEEVLSELGDACLNVEVLFHEGIPFDMTSTGLTLEMADCLQSWHDLHGVDDGNMEEFAEVLDMLLSGEIDCIGSKPFSTLEPRVNFNLEPA